ncbi:MAG: hypothetical protein HYX75_02435 [Acidobacteria bacterium]|nr:hypothetical protein [Acidobacteriota bacterium]
MRRFGVVSLVALVYSMCAQIAAAQPWANRYFDPAGGERIPSCVRALAGGEYIVVGQAIDTKKKVSSGWIMRVGPDESNSGVMEVKWSRTYTNDTQERPSSALTWVEPASDGGFVACGWVHASNSAGDGGQGWIVKLRASGEKVWSSAIGSNGTGQLRRVRVADDGSYVAAGYYAATVTVVGTDGWAVRMSRSGSLRWSATYGEGGMDEFWDLRETSQGGCMVVGFLTQVLGARKVGWALGLSRSGKVQWQKTYEGSENRELTAVSAKADDRFVLAGNIDTPPSGNIGWLLKTSPIGDIDWQSGYSPVDGFPLYFSAVEQAPNGDILVAGRKPDGVTNAEKGGVAAGISSEGTTVEWADVMVGPWLGSVTALDLSQDGVVWVGEVEGYHRQPVGARDCLILSTTRSGEACQDVSSALTIGRSPSASIVTDTSVRRVTGMSPTRLNTRVSLDPVAPAKYCTRPSLDQKLVLSRSPQSDGVTLSYVCPNSGRDTAPFKVRVFFSPSSSIPPVTGSELVLEVDVKDGLKSGQTIGPLYSINAKEDHIYAIALIYPDGKVDDIPVGQMILRVPLP